MLAQDVHVGSQVDVCQADGVDGERSSGEVGARRMAMEYCSAFLARPAKIRLQLPTEQPICLLYIKSAKQGDINGASNIVLPSPGS